MSPRTKQTARKSTGSRAPRKQLGTIAAKRASQDLAAKRSRTTIKPPSFPQEGGLQDVDDYAHDSGGSSTERLCDLARNNTLNTLSYIEHLTAEIAGLKTQMADAPGQLSGLDEVQALRNEVRRLREENGQLYSEITTLRNAMWGGQR
ncbi:hypothetical protein PHLGIDRAFT_161234 [Phlebiopsis gigantea 11061_1 CR5-6]|uniref:Uncharacterized protein n=1 Tax=Phlebiopsis gigantea (strain 11061_1 CR5-6) TaxID=745531 RepID=A0A0C3PHF9_PHLG1|nr:hypothetical protein PHLGIDRAFT_161234 [Phlebiopsis gigantea 11061_1 CR5-6]